MGAAIFVVCVVLLIVGGFTWAMRSGMKVEAARDAKLVQVATGHGLTVKPSLLLPMVFAAEGTVAGAPMRLAVDQVNSRRHGTQQVLRVIVRATAPRPTISVHRRDSERTELGPTFHEVSTGDNEFDRLFVTVVEDDAAALDFLSTVRADLLPFEGASLSGVQSFKVGSEVALAVDCTHPRFFEGGHLERAIDLVLRLTSNASGYRAA
jgi:hypothetical protein